MIEQNGTVTGKANGLLYVRVDPTPGCARCESGQGCGQGLIGQLAGHPAHHVTVAEPVRERVQVGAVVVLGMAPGGLLKASALLYLMPLGLMMVGALGAGAAWPALEGLTVAAGIGGLAAGFLGVRYLIQGERLRAQFEPRFLRTAAGAADELLT